MPHISIIIPTYNCGKYIGEAIESVLNQSYKNLELIIVDGGSQDDTEDIAKGYEKDKRCIFIKKPGYGISAARNYGIKIAQGSFIAFLDGDDLFLNDKILKQVHFLQKYKRENICYTNRVYFNSKTKKEIESTYYHFSGDIFYFLKKSNFIHPSALMARKEIFKDNLFDENLPSHEDWEFFLRLSAKGIRFAFINEILTKIRIREKSITTDIIMMNNTRKEVGLRAKRYWKEFKKNINPFIYNRQQTLLRYLKFKIKAFVIGFPKRKCFRRPVPQELL